MNYVDGFVAAVATSNKDAYMKHAQMIGALFKDYGALQVVDAWGDDVPEGKLTSFPMAVKRGDDEVVALGWVTWPSKAVRDEAWKKMETDPRMANMGKDMPFDGKRMIYGGFQVISQL